MKGNLLIVDDEELLLDILRYSLKNYADNIFIANNGLEGLEILKREDIHCVVCDINMPKMTGIEVLKTMRAQKDNTPFIFYTGNGNLELMKEAAVLGALDFLDKPSVDGLEEVVMKGLRLGLNPTDTTEKTSKFESEYTQYLQEMQNRVTRKAN